MRKTRLYRPFLLFLIAFNCGCHLLIRVNNDPFYESFYEKTRLIMTQNEMKIFKSLKGDELKKVFIEEFW